MKVNVCFKACFFAGFLLLSGCQGTPQADRIALQKPSGVPLNHTINNVPFYAQEQFYCGPTTLSEVFEYYGHGVSASDLAPQIFIPDKEGSLQLEMITATRQYNFLPYTERGTLTKLMQLISSDIPVIVFQNLSIQMLPQWHYAVVTGFDLTSRTLTLHTGVTPNHTMSFELFEKTWGRGNYWLLAPVPSNKISDGMNPFTYVSAAYDMLEVGKGEQAVAFLQTATKQWPNQWLAYFLLGNYYLDEQPDKAVHWFEQGYQVGQNQAAYMNNYAYALANSGNITNAQTIINEALLRFPDDENVKKTASTIKAAE
ncbi:PA2778 family cysteine peptidase [Alteromonas sp. MMG017]|uniref:PA2778 family cysteine peptidase n=1 Tax=Alteromonas sp. MMG017 TaxID=2822692 RepID=UPI001B39E6DB|nr:PA2778 family cysteine peptidase [Alteromonas sp. MMG017]MBQ4828684.1 PA2778 family cysteine peptidase [Alteromonas sp. MMG017]